MKEKFYVSLEVARLLKEKGYNKETIFYYNCTGKLYLGNGHFNHNAYAITFSAPTKAEVIDWLESKGIVVAVNYNRLNATRGKNEWSFCIYDKPYMQLKSEVGITSRLEAEDAAIIKALELL